MADINLGVGGANSAVAGDYDIDNSVKLDKGNDTTTVEFFERTVSSSGNRDVGTFSAWIKKTDVSTAQYLFTFGNTDNDNGRTFARFQTDGTLRIGGGTSVWRNTDRKFRDTSAWYHIVIAFDTTQSTANDRIKLYINGVQETSFSTTNNPSQNDDLGLAFEKQAIGYNTIDNNSGFNGYMSEVVIQDGVASAPTKFGKFDSDTGIWIPKDASGATMGTNGSYLKFENAASMGAASAGNAFTVQNINQNDQSTDTPTNNFCTLNVLHQEFDGDNVVTQGQTVVVQDPGSGSATIVGTQAASSGKWYWEVELDEFEGSGMFYLHGIYSLDKTLSGYPGSDDHSVGIYAQTGNVYYNGSNTSFETNSVGGDGDLIGVFLDLDNSTLRFALNGILLGNVLGTDAIARSGASLTGKNFWTAAFADGTSSTALRTLYKTNFGGYTTISISTAQTDANGYGKFEYNPNDGTYDYYALCTKNLAEYG